MPTIINSGTGKAVDLAVDGVVESGGQKLTMGAVADGEFLKRSGLSVIGGAAGLSNWTEATGTYSGVQWTRLLAANAATNVAAVVTPKGDRGLQARVADGTTTGGNQRGTYAVDWQLFREYANQVASGNCSTIGGGSSNLCSAPSGVIAGGHLNTVSGNRGTVSGGYLNTASGEYRPTVCGGQGNTSSHKYAFVGGGHYNTASGITAAVLGGYSNVASGWGSACLGGSANTASGTYSVTIGGRSNTAQGAYSVAAGRRAKTGAFAGSFRFADSTDADFTAGQAADSFGCRFGGGYFFYSDTGATVGVSVAASGNSWSALSDRALKENMASIDGAAVLDKLDELDVPTWNLKAQGAGIRHIGPMAQDLYAAFGFGESERHITQTDADGILFAAVKALIQRVKQLELALQNA